MYVCASDQVQRVWGKLEHVSYMKAFSRMYGIHLNAFQT